MIQQQGELEKAVVGAPVGLPSLSSKTRSRSKSTKKETQRKQATQSNPEKRTSFLAGVCETVLERLGPCKRGEDGGQCELKHPPDCTESACHAKGGRQATGCDGWHLFKKYSLLKAERKENAKATKERKAAERKASAHGQLGGGSKKSAKGNGGPGKKAATPGQQQPAKKERPTSKGKAHNRNTGRQAPRVQQPQGLSQQQVYPVGHQEWAVNRQPMTFYSHAAPQHGFQATPAVPVYNPYHPLSSQAASGF